MVVTGRNWSHGELVLALLQLFDGTWPGVLGRADVQQTLALTSITCREKLGPPLDYGPDAAGK